MSLMSETTRSHWFPTEPIEEEGSVYCLPEEHSSEMANDLSVLVATWSSKARSHKKT